jgi:hypothetical protein
MAIPKNITKEHVLMAVSQIEPPEIPNNRRSYHYFLLHEGKEYPPKFVLGEANKYANGEELKSTTFNAIEAKDFLIKKGFKIIEKGDSFFPALLRFLKQTDTSELSTKRFVREFLGLNVKVSFGRGNLARIPWIAFLKEPNTVQKGIYPVYLYFKSKKLLILAFGVSETNKPSSSWGIEGVETIEEFFKKKYNESPERYGSSFVFKTYSYDSNDLIGSDEEEVENHLREIIDVYKKEVGERITQYENLNKQSVSVIRNYILSKGFQYSYEEIANFFLSLKVKPFVILAGISGTGKTQLPRKFAEAVGMDKDQVIQVPVRPDWTDGSDLLGYTGLDDEFKPKDLTIAIIKAQKGNHKPFFFILDEMNLARVEHYFSDFLSIIETREWTDGKGSEIITDSILKKESLQNAKNGSEYSGLKWPPNLFLIGTVNMDETTHTFSRKVLDRANTIEMNEVDLDWPKEVKEKTVLPQKLNPLFLKTEYLSANDLSSEEKSKINEELQRLKHINEILKIADLHFAYRVRDEFAFYLMLNNRSRLLDEKIAFDFQLIQKVLPRIHGSSERVQKVLVKLLNFLEGQSFSEENVDLEYILKTIDPEELSYPRSSKKILYMLKRYEDDRFTSFWL